MIHATVGVVVSSVYLCINCVTRESLLGKLYEEYNCVTSTIAWEVTARHQKLRVIGNRYAIYLNLEGAIELTGEPH